MAEFGELIKRPDRVRDYIRGFYLFGWRTRDGYDAKSGRSYDNERRRIESWLSSDVRRTRTARGRSVALSVDLSDRPRNPLYVVWKTKSFTRNDILLHFFILDLLADGRARTAEAIADELTRYGEVFEASTVRLKLREYAREGLLEVRKEGRRQLFALSALHASDLGEDLFSAVDFFTETAPFGEVGSHIQDELGRTNETFRFKHDFIVHTLESEVLLALLGALEERRSVVLTLRYGESVIVHTGVPLKIPVGVQSGRRYVCLREARGFFCHRLDRVESVVPGAVDAAFDGYLQELDALLPLAWGVSLRRRPQVLELRLSIHETHERYVLDRLAREGRGGTLTRESRDTFLYRRTVLDAGEMMPFVKSFIGRILSLSCSNRRVTNLFANDLRRACRVVDPAPDTPAGEVGAIVPPLPPVGKPDIPTKGRGNNTRLPSPEGVTGAGVTPLQIFHEIYGRYYGVVARLLRRAGRSPLGFEGMRGLIGKWGFAETPLFLTPKLMGGEWPLFREANGLFFPRVEHTRRPLSLLERRWLAAVLEDERMGLFLDDGEREAWRARLGNAAPLYRESDFHVFDRAADPDPFGDEGYRARFRTILGALKEGRNLYIEFTSGKGEPREGEFLPLRLQYSLKDDKFRLLALRVQGNRAVRRDTVNLGRTRRVDGVDRDPELVVNVAERSAGEPVVLALTNERKAPERALIHFAGFECLPRADENAPERVLLEIRYDPQDETELLVRVLSFLPMVRVVGPERFARQVRERLTRQRDLPARRIGGQGLIDFI